MTKLTIEKIKKIIEEKDNGVKTNMEIADSYGVSTMRIQQLNKLKRFCSHRENTYWVK